MWLMLMRVKARPEHEKAAVVAPALATTAAFYIFKRSFVFSCEGSYILHQAGVFWAQYGYSGSRIAALNGTVAVLITRWVHDDFVTPSLGLLPRFKMLEVTYHAAGM